MPFFTKDRLKNFKTYFFEVIVIFTGITASFYFDEWRKDQERISLERDYLVRLDADLSNDITGLEGLVEYNKEQLEYCEIGMNAMNGNKSADTIFSHVTGIYLFELNDYTITEMQSTGVFYSIENTQLKNEILHYYHSADEMMRIYFKVIDKNEDLQDELNKHLKLKTQLHNFAKFEVKVPVDGNLVLENYIYEKKNYLEFLLFFAPDLAEKAKNLRVSIADLLKE